MPTLFNCLPSCQALANCQHTHIHTHTHLQAGKHNGIAGDPGIGLVLAASSLGGCAVGGAVGGGSKGKRGTFALNVFAFWNVSRFDCNAGKGSKWDRKGERVNSF